MWGCVRLPDLRMFLLQKEKKGGMIHNPTSVKIWGLRSTILVEVGSGAWFPVSGGHSVGKFCTKGGLHLNSTLKLNKHVFYWVFFSVSFLNTVFISSFNPHNPGPFGISNKCLGRKWS